MDVKSKTKTQGNHPADALAKLFAAWQPSPTAEDISVADAAGRVLAQDAVAILDVPSASASMMDGVAVHSVVFEQGMPDTSSWELGVDYVRANTGVAFDDGFDAVIPIEDVDLSGGKLRFIKAVTPKPGDLIRMPGTTMKSGRMLAGAGKLLSSTDVAMLAMGGLVSVKVLPKPRVAFIPTGSELVPFGQTPAVGQAVDCNSLTARLLLEEYGAEPHVCNPLPEDQTKIRAALEAAVAANDIVLVNGGTSKGSADVTKDVLESCGKLTSSWMNSGPGRPVGAGVVDGTCVVAVPGPPLGMINVMEYFVSSVIDHWYGIQTHRHTVTATLTEDVRFPADMMMLVNAELSYENGRVLARPFFFKKDSVAALASQGYFYSPIGTELQEAGTQVEVALFGKRQQSLTPYPFSESI